MDGLTITSIAGFVLLAYVYRLYYASFKSDCARGDCHLARALDRIADLEDTVARMRDRRRDMKHEAGFDDRVSFDVVWAACLKAYREQQNGQR